MANTLDHLAAYIDGATALTAGTNLFAGLMPDSPIDNVTLYEYAGDLPREMIGGSATAVERPRVQVVARSASYPSARANAQTVWDALSAVNDQSLSGTRYLRIQPLQSVFFMGRDDNRNIKCAFNCTIEKVPG